ncbi:gluconate:H+ symporter [Lactococcus termiticola]|uniref:Gluconate:proton symporter n=1 Tax=Lactococcus termiticola TaxID=2169526 RepID=A0A2R5HDR6_9LACT|nr:gluconate:H+ symporter [Lactococcus termiticola]GBG96162.1 gluconate:proton symporter [Lactococcus termiticola]
MTSFIVLALGVLFLLLMIIKFKMNTFIALILTAVLVGLGLGMPLGQIPASIEKGIGSSLGELAIVFGFGAMLGRLIADAGGAYRIAKTLINAFGKKRMQWAIMVASFIIGIALFFEVGMVLLIPIVFAVALEASVPLLYLGVPMAAGLSVTHGFLPPHPAPIAISGALGANPGTVLLFGIIAAIPTVIVAGPIFTVLAKKFVPEAFVVKKKLTAFGEMKEWKLEETPGFGISIITALMPVILMAISTIYSIIANDGKPFAAVVKNSVDSAGKLTTTSTYPHSLLENVIMFIGNPVSAMILSLLFALVTMGWMRRKQNTEIAETIVDSVKSIAMLLLVIGGGAAFKQVLIDGGISGQIADLFQGSSLSPLILAWIITVILRIALGSATVAALTAAGLVQPLLASASPNMAALMVLAIGAGSIAASHVNDAGFWMFKEYFDLDVKQTLKTWTVLETIIAVVGLAMVLIMSIWIH